MALGKQEKSTVQTEKTYDLGNTRDRMTVLEFEEKIKPYRSQKLELFRGTTYQRTLTGFDLYLHSTNLFRYSAKYPLGAVVRQNAESFRQAMAKNKALCLLNDRRAYRENEELARIESLAVNG